MSSFDDATPVVSRKYWQRLRILSERATRDYLSGLLNRETATLYIENYLKTMPQDELCALFIIDLDNFKMVNDTFGHQAGDDIIHQAAAALSRCFRVTDIVGRLGGDEFFALLSGKISTEVIRKKAKTICEQLQFSIGGPAEVRITASIGVAIAQSGTNFEFLYARADAALYKAKKDGRHRFQIDDAQADSAASATDVEPDAPALLPVSVQTLLTHMDEGIFLLEVTSPVRVLYLSPASCKMLHLEPENLSLPCLLSDLLQVHPDYAAELSRRLNDSLQNAKTLEYELRYAPAQGAGSAASAGSRGHEWRWCRLKMIRWTESTEGAPTVLVLCSDVSAAKNISAAAYEDQQRLRLALSLRDRFLWEVDIPTRTFRFYNTRHHLRENGIALENFPESLIERGWIHPSSVDKFRVFAQEILSGNAAGGTALALRHKTSRHYRWFSVFYSRLSEQIGRPAKVIGVVETLSSMSVQQDFLGKERLWEALRPTLFLYLNANLTEDSVESLWIEGRNLTRQTQEIRYSQIIGRNKYKLFFPEDAMDFVRQFDRETLLKAHANRQYWITKEYRRVDSGGNIRHFSYTALLSAAPSTGNVHCFLFLQNADRRHAWARALQNRSVASRGFYDRETAKAMAGQALKNVLEAPQGHNTLQALLLVRLVGMDDAEGSPAEGSSVDASSVEETIVDPLAAPSAPEAAAGPAGEEKPAFGTDATVQNMEQWFGQEVAQHYLQERLQEQLQETGRGFVMDQQKGHLIATAFSLFTGPDCVIGQRGRDTFTIFLPYVLSTAQLRQRMDDAFAFVRRALPSMLLLNSVRFVCAGICENLQDADYDVLLSEAEKICNTWQSAPEDTLIYFSRKQADAAEAMRTRQHRYPFRSSLSKKPSGTPSGKAAGRQSGQDDKSPLGNGLTRASGEHLCTPLQDPAGSALEADAAPAVSRSWVRNDANGADSANAAETAEIAESAGGFGVPEVADAGDGAGGTEIWKEDENFIYTCLDLIIKADSPDSAIRDVLDRIGDYYGADRVYTLALTRSRQQVIVTNEWCSGTRPSIKNVVTGTKLAQMPLLKSSLEQERPIFVHSQSVYHNPQTAVQLAGDPARSQDWNFAVIPLQSDRDEWAGCFLCLEHLTRNMGTIRRLKLLLPYLFRLHKKYAVFEDSTDASLDALTGFSNRQSYQNAVHRLNSDKYSSMGVLSLNMPLLDPGDGYLNRLYSKTLVHIADVLSTIFDRSLIFRTRLTEFIVFCPNTTQNMFLDRVLRTQSILQRRYQKSMHFGYTWADGLFWGEKLVREARAIMLCSGDGLPREATHAEPAGMAADSMPGSGNADWQKNFTVYLQPKINMQTGHVFGAEALVRGIDAKGRLVSPSRFIEEMEKAGTIRELDFYVLHSALACLENWRQAGIPPIPIAVNFSRVTFFNPSSPGAVLAILSRYPEVDPALLEIEITESVGDVESSTFERTMASFRQFGLRFALDDFGSSYANFSMFTNVRFDTVKLDRSLTRELSYNAVSRSLVGNIVRICNRQGIQCVAEGVETQAQSQVLLEEGCVYAQGFYYDSPIPTDEFRQKYLQAISNA